MKGVEGVVTQQVKGEGAGPKCLPPFSSPTHASFPIKTPLCSLVNNIYHLLFSIIRGT